MFGKHSLPCLAGKKVMSGNSSLPDTGPLSKFPYKRVTSILFSDLLL